MRSNRTSQTPGSGPSESPPFSELSHSTSRLIARWHAAEPRILPFDEDTRCSLLHELSDRPAAQLNAVELSNLKAFAEEARAEFPNLVTGQAIDRALRDERNVISLIQRIHPYTLDVLRSPEDRTHHFRLHEGMYYYLAAKRFLNGETAAPVVLNWDPHTDDYNHHELQTRDNYSADGRFVTHGVAHYNWAGAAVRDGLASAVVRAARAPEGWTAHLIDQEAGELHIRNFSLLTCDEDGLFKTIVRRFPELPLELTIDLDSFSSRGNRYFEGGHQRTIPQMKRELGRFFRAAEDAGVTFPCTVSADSRSYLYAPKEHRYRPDEDWITLARKALARRV